VVTELLAMPVAVAIALRVVVVLMVIGAEYLLVAVVGVDPSVV
jgi:hypothetical protein